MKNTLKELLENDIEKYKQGVDKAETTLKVFIGLFVISLIAFISVSISYVNQKSTIKLMKGKHYSDSLAIKSIEDNFRMGSEIRKFNELNK